MAVFKEKQYKEAMGDRYPKHVKTTERSEKLEEERASLAEKREAVLELRRKLGADPNIPDIESGSKGPLRASQGPMPDLPKVKIDIKQAYTKQKRLIVKAHIKDGKKTEQMTINVASEHGDDKDALLAYIKEQYFLLKNNNSKNEKKEIKDLTGESEI